jgi:hypothetical protein
MKKFNYKIEELTFSDLKQLEGHLNSIGNNGWELIRIDYAGVSNPDRIFATLFSKREITS